MEHKITARKGERLELTVELGKNDLEKYLTQAEQRLAQQVTIPGFRPGKAPARALHEHLGDAAILEEALKLALSGSLDQIVAEEKLDVLRTADLKIKENTAEKLDYEVVLTVFPEVKLGQYKDLKVTRPEITVSEQEIDEAVEYIKKANGQNPAVDSTTTKPLNLPTDIREKLNVAIRQDKEREAKEKYRLLVLDQVVTNSELAPSAEMIDSQLEAMVGELKHSLSHQNSTLEQYLEKIKKSEKEMRNEWRQRAEREIRHALVMRAIAQQENIRADEDWVRKESEVVWGKYFADLPADKQPEPAALRSQIRERLLSEAILHWLEQANN
ncbi:MAG: hypothetical protein A3F25_01530 [Candidatus Yanofskybacteria bacterium RIFCSPHIGHO2_12_FULL_45_19b]|uniref:Trigger factor n=1 Tax=Candidatus Yanofskybacteria bacterium RIFCSPHIGHO2_12_FULL_45_19b TaxID=1802689 RepID=A0A1F8G205_9BACT|nr:MAG: hypothetical protein A3F25_01530 [Candidatus Yanofskybacteria bacterium RIFCSPHIGHO2_12_FULL_45_19b]